MISICALHDGSTYTLGSDEVQVTVNVSFASGTLSFFTTTGKSLETSLIEKETVAEVLDS